MDTCWDDDIDELFSEHAWLYYIYGGMWKRQGSGQAKLLKEKKREIVRFILKDENTGEIIRNHCIFLDDTYCDLRPFVGRKRCWVWTVLNCSDGKPTVENLLLKFTGAEVAMQFKKTLDGAKMASSKFLLSKILTECLEEDGPSSTNNNLLHATGVPATFELPQPPVPIPPAAFSIPYEDETMAIPTGAVLAWLGLPDHINFESVADEVHSQCSTLWQLQDGLWKDRGAGNAKLLKDGSTGIVRFVFREDKTKSRAESLCF